MEYTYSAGVYRPSFDSPTMAQSIHEVHCLLKYILSSRQQQQQKAPPLSDICSSRAGNAPIQQVINACHLMFRECFHVFYPSGVLKWYAACRFLERLDPVRYVFVLYNKTDIEKIYRWKITLFDVAFNVA